MGDDLVGFESRIDDQAITAALKMGDVSVFFKRS
jgi:hypothetical protein